MQSSVLTVCRLCAKEAELVDSHIYPAWFIKDHLQPGNGVPFLISSTQGVFPKKFPKGISEELLCRVCDNSLIGGIEGKACTAYRRMKEWFVETALFPNSEFRVPLRYAEDIHLFALSLVFRALSSTNDFFRLLRDCPNSGEVAARIGAEIISRNVSRQMLVVFRRDMTDLQLIISPECVMNGESIGCLIRFGHWNFFVHLAGPVFAGWSSFEYTDANEWRMYSHETSQDLEIAREIAIKANSHRTQKDRRRKL